MPSLYELTNEFLHTKQLLEEMELDELTFEDTLDAIKMPIEEKAENIVKLMKEWEALADAKKLEAKRLSESATNDLKKVERLKQYLQSNLETADIKKLQAGVFTLSFRKGSEVVEIDETRLPEWAFVPQDPKPLSKTEFKAMLKEGVEVPGVRLVRKDDSLVIK